MPDHAMIDKNAYIKSLETENARIHGNAKSKHPNNLWSKWYIIVRNASGGWIREMAEGNPLPVKVNPPHSFTGDGPALLLVIF